MLGGEPSSAVRGGEDVVVFYWPGAGVGEPGEVYCEVYSKELGTFHPLYHNTVDADWEVISGRPPEVNNHVMVMM